MYCRDGEQLNLDQLTMKFIQELIAKLLFLSSDRTTLGFPVASVRQV